MSSVALAQIIEGQPQVQLSTLSPGSFFKDPNTGAIYLVMSPFAGDASTVVGINAANRAAPPPTYMVQPLQVVTSAVLQ